MFNSLYEKSGAQTVGELLDESIAEVKHRLEVSQREFNEEQASMRRAVVKLELQKATLSSLNLLGMSIKEYRNQFGV